MTVQNVDNFRFTAFLAHPDAMLDPVKAAVEVGYSQSTAEARAYTWRKENLSLLNERMRTHLKDLAVTPEWVKNEVKILADTTLSDFVEFVEDKKKGQMLLLKPVDKIDPAKWRAAIKEAEFDTHIMQDGSIRSVLFKLKLYDRQAALVELGNLLGLKNPMLQAALAPIQPSQSEEQKVMEHMTVEELETIATIQERAAARMRKAASKRRDAQAIPGTAGEGGGSSSHSPASRSRTLAKGKTAALPSSESEYDKE